MGPTSNTTNKTTTWSAEVIVMPKEGVNDPAGEAILGGLHSLGHDAVDRVRAGRVLHLAVKAPDAEIAQTVVTRMCEQLLANPVIESYQVTVSPAKEGSDAAS